VKRLLLLSNSTNFGSRYLDHAWEAIRTLFGSARLVAFVPFALHDQDAYTARVQASFEREGLRVRGATSDAAGRALLESADGVFVGGGNTFRLLDHLLRSDLIEVLRRRALAGLPYLGASAGTNIAGPTIRTTNDMPIVEPSTLSALGLVPFQINPHYLDPDPASEHMGETRETRLREYLEENTAPVVGLREGSWLQATGALVTLGGARAARIFRRDRDPIEVPPGTDLSSLLGLLA
jgi:dipeptidase E